MAEFAAAPKGGLAGFVERSLKQALLEGRLRPGERLVTRELAHQLGTSLTPVREALLKLAAAGALEAAPSQSFQVPVMTEAGYREIADIRAAVEGLAAERATQVIRPETLAALRDLNDEFPRGEAARRGRPRTRAEQVLPVHALRERRDAAVARGDRAAMAADRPQPEFPLSAAAARRSSLGTITTCCSRRWSDGTASGVRRAIEQAIEAGTRILLANMAGISSLRSP